MNRPTKIVFREEHVECGMLILHFPLRSFRFEELSLIFKVEGWAVCLSSE